MFQHFKKYYYSKFSSKLKYNSYIYAISVRVSWYKSDIFPKNYEIYCLFSIHNSKDFSK
jgi:hypothetical protein